MKAKQTEFNKMRAEPHHNMRRYSETTRKYLISRPNWQQYWAFLHFRKC